MKETARCPKVFVFVKGMRKVLVQKWSKVVFNTKGQFTEEEFATSQPLCEGINITVSGIEKLLKQLNLTKASGPHNISPRVLKEVASETAPSLTLINRASMKSGIVPKDWKSAHIAPIFKKGERFKPENYRPISLTSFLSTW